MNSQLRCTLLPFAAMSICLQIATVQGDDAPEILTPLYHSTRADQARHAGDHRFNTRRTLIC